MLLQFIFYIGYFRGNFDPNRVGFDCFSIVFTIRQVFFGHRALFESFDSEDGPELEDINFLINTGSTLFIINYDGTGVAVLDYQADDMGLDIKAGSAYMAEVKAQYPLVDVIGMV